MKKKDIDYFSLSKGLIVFLIGLVLFIISLLFKQAVGGTSLIIAFEWIGFILIYFGLVSHMVIIGDKPFFNSWAYVKDSKNFIYLSVGLFFLFALIGLFVPTPDFISEKIFEMIQEILKQTEGLGWGGFIGFIFLNNFKSSLFAIILGAILGILPLISVIFNGYLLGFVASIIIKGEGVLSLWRILPHGIFELPAIFISFGMGIKFGTFIFQKNKLECFRKYFWSSMKVFFYIVLPLLIVAAIIEGTLIFLAG